MDDGLQGLSPGSCRPWLLLRLAVPFRVLAYCKAILFKGFIQALVSTVAWAVKYTGAMVPFPQLKIGTLKGALLPVSSKKT